MTAVVIAALGGLALVDGAFSGFRASLGRTGLVHDTAADREGLRRGALLAAALASPAIASMGVHLTIGGSMETYRQAGLAFLIVVGPFALVIVLALAVYAALRWELGYLASALVLGPFTLLRPYVVVAAGTWAILSAPAIGVAVTALLAAAAVLLVEPILNQHYGPRPVGSSKARRPWPRGCGGTGSEP